MKPHILLVEDDLAVQQLLAAYIGNSGYRVSIAADGNDARAMLDGSEIDLVLLDLNLPDGNGMSLAREIRAASRVGIIMVTDRSAPADRALGLEIGADDYVTKPVYPRELLARIRNVLDRKSGARDASQHDVWRFAGWSLDLSARILTGPDGTQPEVTPAEFDLLTILVTRGGRVQSRDQLMSALGSDEAESGPRSIDILISRVRKKLGDAEGAIIETARGHGYRCAAEVTRG